jgi:hypothetical protein
MLLSFFHGRGGTSPPAARRGVSAIDHPPVRVVFLHQSIDRYIDERALNYSRAY